MTTANEIEKAVKALALLRSLKEANLNKVIADLRRFREQ